MDSLDIICQWKQWMLKYRYHPCKVPTHLEGTEHVKQLNAILGELGSIPTPLLLRRRELELEGKLGPKFQPQSGQSRPTQPITNPCVRKETKVNDKRKKLIPTKRYKVQVVAKPKSTPKTSDMTMNHP